MREPFKLRPSHCLMCGNKMSSSVCVCGARYDNRAPKTKPKFSSDILPKIKEILPNHISKERRGKTR